MESHSAVLRADSGFCTQGSLFPVLIGPTGVPEVEPGSAARQTLYSPGYLSGSSSFLFKNVISLLPDD